MVATVLHNTRSLQTEKGKPVNKLSFSMNLYRNNPGGMKSKTPLDSMLEKVAMHRPNALAGRAPREGGMKRGPAAMLPLGGHEA